MSDAFFLGARNEYTAGELREVDTPSDPLAALRWWLADATAAGEREPTAMVVATVDADGAPSTRTVLCRAIDGGGLVLYTNLASRKSRELAARPQASATFRWDVLQRQVHVRGRAEAVSDPEAEAYFAGRPRGSQLSAWASRQSEPIARRDDLEGQLAKAAARFPGVVPRPPFWGGWRIVATEVELWQGRRSRLHDRLLYVRSDAGASWSMTRLQP